MIFIDTNIFMYAAGAEHPNKARAVQFLEKVAKSHSSVLYCTNTEVLQELLHRYQSLQRLDIALSLFDAIMNLPIEVKSITLSALKHAKRILSKDSAVGSRDAVHAGMMIEMGFETMVSFDRDFDRFDAIKRVEP